MLQVDIHKYRAITIYPFIQWSRNNIYRIICMDELVANCFSLSLSLFRFSNYEDEEEIHKRKYRAKVGNFQFIPLSPRDYFHRVKLVRFWKILLSPCQSNIPRALFKQRNPSVFNPCFYNFSIKFNYPRLFSPLFFKRRNSGGELGPGINSPANNSPFENVVISERKYTKQYKIYKGHRSSIITRTIPWAAASHGRFRYSLLTTSRNTLLHSN